MIHILSIHNQVMVYVEDEVPWVCEGFTHCFEFVKISPDGSFALLKFSSDISNDGA